MGFSKESLNKMIIISSQKSTILDCNNGKLENCIIEYDEEELPETTKQGEQVLIQEISEHIRTVTFIYNQDKKIKIFESYGPYICGFSYDGNYFMIADDAGIIVLKMLLFSLLSEEEKKYIHKLNLRRSYNDCDLDNWSFVFYNRVDI